MSSPAIRRDLSLRRGLAAVALFVVLAAVFLNARFGDAAGFGADAQVTRSIGAALFNLNPGAVTDAGGAVSAEGFLVALILIAVLLDAALDGALMLAKRDERGGESE